ncbi:regenerating islet-derived protein 4-like [Protopterus annectens]|uniref:regenerating islet-derived protein 4-like n=1 Tax=Protopterus annectens TaxID=7888 RepID=UPI001CFB9911|nr:regenerating islet-derived protein 4-like [Protopterus annectens]
MYLGPVLLLLAGCTLLTESAVVRAGCPPGWFYYKSNCYGYFRFQLPWSEAEFECQSYGHGAHIASILDDAEASVIASHISAYQKSEPVWIGLHDPEHNRRWKWTDGSMYNWRAWSTNEPNNQGGNEYCVELEYKDGFRKWNDKCCDIHRQFVCKFKP